MGKKQDILTDSLSENIKAIKSACGQAKDLFIRKWTVSGIPVCLVTIENMVDLRSLALLLTEPMSRIQLAEPSSSALFAKLRDELFLTPDTTPITELSALLRRIMSGFAVLLIDGQAQGLSFGIQGFGARPIDEPTSEVNEEGSREGFTEPLRINIAMVRRRLKTPDLQTEYLTVGETAKVDVCLVYLKSKAAPELLKQVRQKLARCKTPLVLASGYLQPFLEGSPFSLFSEVGKTERPDVLAGKIDEGRVAILVDGTPHALIVPFLFSENFQTMDDYALPAYYTSFLRLIKYAAFLVSAFLPGLYVGIGTFSPELLPPAMLYQLAAVEQSTPFPLVLEALLIYFLFEIMHESGLRLPRPIGHAVSIVGGLVIGDAAIQAGLIGAPMMLVLATTALCSFVVPTLYRSVSILRLIVILAAAAAGLFGVTVVILVLLCNFCALRTCGAAFMSPIAPFSLVAMRDTILRLPFPFLQRRLVKIQDLSGMKMTRRDVNQ